MDYDLDDDAEIMLLEDELSDPEDEQDDEIDDFDIIPEGEQGEPSAKRHLSCDEDEFSYDCLTPESIVSTMNACIDDVNSVFEVRNPPFGEND